MLKRPYSAHLIRLSALLAAFALCACSGMKHSLYEMALDRERGKAGLAFERFDVNGKSIALLESRREPGKPNLILVHGFGANKDNWVRFSRHLSGDYHVVAVDLPGHGESVKDPQLRYDLDDQVRYLNDILEQMKIRKFHIAGNSMGGAIASLYAAKYPEQVQSLVLMAPGGIYPYESELSRMLAQGKNPLIVSRPEDFSALMDFALEKKPFIPWPISSVLAEKAVANKPINDKIFADIRGEHSYKFEDELKKITAPTLILWGRKDRVLNVDNAQVFEQLIPNSQKTILEEIGHVPMVEAPEETAGICRDFMNKNSAKGDS